MINKGIVLSLMTLCRSSLLTSKDVKENIFIVHNCEGRQTPKLTGPARLSQ